jgi:hypothetical protein
MASRPRPDCRDDSLPLNPLRQLRGAACGADLQDERASLARPSEPTGRAVNRSQAGPEQPSQLRWPPRRSNPMAGRPRTAPGAAAARLAASRACEARRGSARDGPPLRMSRRRRARLRARARPPRRPAAAGPETRGLLRREFGDGLHVTLRLDDQPAARERRANRVIDVPVRVLVDSASRWHDSPREDVAREASGCDRRLLLPHLVDC